jgi:hypothetical protein
MSSKNSKPEPEIPVVKKTMGELYPSLPFLPDTPDRPRYRPLVATVDHLRKRLESLPDLPDEIDISSQEPQARDDKN